MEETIVIPSPNWFQVSILGVSNDGWLVYGGPSKSLCFLEPIPSESIGTIDSKQRFKAHVFNRAHKEKIVSVDISPEWPEKRNIITGGIEGVVKEWTIEPKERGWTINYLHCHEYHSVEKEDVAGVCYGTPTHAVSVGSGGNICKWDLNTNVVKSYYMHLRNFKPTCISCSPHKLLHVAVGTRQGVIFVIDISGSGATGKLIYKVRGQDDEINRVSWCPQYRVFMNKTIEKEKRKKKEPYTAAIRMERIRNDQDPSGLETSTDKKQLKEKQPEDEEEVIIPEDDMFDVYKDHEDNEFGHKKFEPEDVVVKVKEERKDDFLAECAKLKAEILKKMSEPEPSIESLVEAMDKAHVREKPGCSNTSENLQLKQENQDSQIETQKSKQESDESRQETQEAEQDIKGSKQETEDLKQETKDTEKIEESQETDTEHNEQKHLLASIGKYGGVRIWSKTGKLIASCTVTFAIKRDQKDHKNKGPNWPTLHWYKPDSLLIADGKNQLLEANPLQVDSKNKLDWHVVHTLHRRGLFCVMSNAPRVQTPAMLAAPHDWVVWTVGQDRYVISYDMKENKKIETHTSCGGYIYEVKPCPYDAGKIAMGAGDGSLRVWETHATNELEDQLASGVITSHWQHVQGKVLTVAWHPTKENLLAFSTAESRVGVLDVSGSCERPAKNLPPALSHGVYSLCWGEGEGEGMALYACGGGNLALFRANKIDDQPVIIKVEVEGQSWEISAAVWTPHGLLVGSNNGGLALLDHSDRHVITANFVFLKMIHNIVWHPQQISSCHEDSKYKNYIAVSSMDKSNTIAVLEFDDKDGAKQFKTLTPLSGHESSVLQVAWNPHRDAQLLSTSQDATVRIWNVEAAQCVAIFGGHTMSTLGAMWCPQPTLADKVLSGGGDCCLRLWDINDYPVELFEGVKSEPKHKKKSPAARARERRERAEKLKETEVKKEQSTDPEINDENKVHELSEILENVATTSESKIKGAKTFLLPITAKQVNNKAMTEVSEILTKYMEEYKSLNIQDIIKNYVPIKKGLDFLKIFGTINEVNELLDKELDYHHELHYWDSYLMLLFYRGKVDDMIKFASDNDLLDPYLLSLSPSVSFKYWKDSTMLYLAQLDRVAAKGGEEKTNNACKMYGGLIFRKATALLSIHNLKGAVEVLMEGLLYKEAYMLCRLRHMDSFAEEVLLKWAQEMTAAGSLMMSTIVYLVRGDVSEATNVLSRSTEVAYLKLATDLAKLAGHNTFASHIETRIKVKEIAAPEPDILPELPTRMELLMNKEDSERGELNVDVCNGNATVNDNVVKKAVPNGNASVDENATSNGRVETLNGNGIPENERCV